MSTKRPTAKTKDAAKVRGTILRSPHMSEKASALGASEGAYVFKVYASANKTEIAKEVMMLYGVNVRGVRIVRIPSKKRRRGSRMGEKPGYKKAIVRLAKGETIETVSV
ncbi:MAG: 50S ribosomal protein L23 [Candidatus Wildermuthbacteria bacterium]|nr:50S ribosomal protein L23 [Candidatus Wildermuthbacteria bacterium]